MGRIFNPFLESSVPLPENLKRLPLRRIKVFKTEEFVVPQYVKRVEYKGTGTTFGWQVYFKKPTKFFNDFDGNPTESLKNAVGYLSEIYKEC
jgi:hypothetical protein